MRERPPRARLRGTVLGFLCAILTAEGAGPASARSFASVAGPEVVAVSPGAGTGAGRTFRFYYADPDGASDIAFAEAVIVSGTDLTGVSACFIYASGSHFWLRDDTNGVWLGPVAAGSPGRLANTQCALSAAGSSIAASGNGVTVSVTLTFTMPFAGTKAIYMRATDRAGVESGWLRAGTWRVTPVTPGLDVVTSSCADASRDTEYSIRIVPEQGGRVWRLLTTSPCFPSHSDWGIQEGLFLDDRRPVPVMGRTSGHFSILAVFVDRELNRRKLSENTSVSSSVRAQISAGRIQEALAEVFASYTPQAIMSGLRREAASAVEFSFEVAISPLSRAELEQHDGGLAFLKYDAVVLLDDLGRSGGQGVRRWPTSLVPLFNGRDRGYMLIITPDALTPGLFGNELLRRNVPVLLSEYQIGERTLVTEGGVIYDRTPVINPRTGENIEPLVRANQGMTSIGVYIAGYADVDGDSIVDCIDPDIAPTVDNVDADFIPDRFDPDLRVNHRPYSWMYAARPN